MHSLLRGATGSQGVHFGKAQQFPGLSAPGFFELAEQLGKDTSDILLCWITELKRVHAHWGAA